MASPGGVAVGIQSSDLNEQAIRLGAANPWERNGDVVYFDDFENGVERWRTLLEPPVWSSASSATGGFSCRFPLVAANDYRSILWNRYPPYLMQNRYCGVQMSFALGHVNDRIHIYLGYNDRGRFHIMMIEFISRDTGYDIYYGTSHEIVVGGPYLEEDPQIYHTVKLVGDFQTDHYVRMELDGTAIDLSQYEFYTVLGLGETFNFSVINIEGRNTNLVTSDVFLDNLILTINEPATL